MEPVEVGIMRLGLDRSSNSYVIILQEKGGSRLLPIWIGQPEAESIVIEMNGIHRERPLTHDLCKRLIDGLGASLHHVNITKVQNRTYFAELSLVRNGVEVRLDARPSDSIAIAIRCAAPIYADDSLLTAILLEEGEVDVQSAPELPSGEMTAEQLKAYLENLRPEDFGKFSI